MKKGDDGKELYGLSSRSSPEGKSGDLGRVSGHNVERGCLGREFWNALTQAAAYSRTKAVAYML